MEKMTSLTQATKITMEYTDQPKACEHCKFVVKDPLDDTGFSPACGYSNLCTFSVKHHGNCKFFEPKPKQ